MLRSCVITMWSSSGRNTKWFMSLRSICSCCAGLYRPKLRGITVLRSGPSLALIPWACLSTVSSVDHSCAGAAISGGVPTRVINNTSLAVGEWYADHVGIQYFLGWQCLVRQVAGLSQYFLGCPLLRPNQGSTHKPGKIWRGTTSRFCSVFCHTGGDIGRAFWLARWLWTVKELAICTTWLVISDAESVDILWIDGCW